ncbi:hypothetical protein O3P69_001852 [Scylla paramamosain]|uniref:Uncharacterized protein n=1 Tax=Scylla paramamosain TaxID=85552 RepID=A0AAW0UZS6_SCYPA
MPNCPKCNKPVYFAERKTSLGQGLALGLSTLREVQQDPHSRRSLRARRQALLQQPLLQRPLWTRRLRPWWRRKLQVLGNEGDERLVAEGRGLIRRRWTRKKYSDCHHHHHRYNTV